MTSKTDSPAGEARQIPPQSGKAATENRFEIPDFADTENLQGDHGGNAATKARYDKENSIERLRESRIRGANLKSQWYERSQEVIENKGDHFITNCNSQEVFENKWVILCKAKRLLIRNGLSTNERQIIASMHKGTSRATLQANRANSLKSTGPVTEQALAISRRNALKHWGRAETVRPSLAALDEDLEEFDPLRDALYRALAPRDEFEEIIVDDMADVHRRTRAWCGLRQAPRARGATMARCGKMRSMPPSRPGNSMTWFRPRNWLRIGPLVAHTRAYRPLDFNERSRNVA